MTKKPTRVDISVVCTQDQGRKDDPISNAIRAAITVAHFKALKEHGVDGHISFHSEVSRSCCGD